MASGPVSDAVTHGLVAQPSPPPLSDPAPTIPPLFSTRRTKTQAPGPGGPGGRCGRPRIDPFSSRFRRRPWRGAAGDLATQDTAATRLEALVTAHGLSPATVAAVAAAGPKAVAAALLVGGIGSLDAAAAALAPVFAGSTGLDST